MTVICESTLSVSVDVQVRAYECLAMIMCLHYDKMANYMEQALFEVSRIRVG